MRSNSTCIIRCTLDNMFRNSKQFSTSPPLHDAGSFRAADIPAFAADAAHALPASQPLASNDGYGLPQCRQYMNIDAHSCYTPDSAQDLPAHFTGRSSKSIDMQCPHVSMHTQCTSMPEHIEAEMCTHAAPPKEIHEYDFLRCMEEGPRPVLAHEDVDCTLHLGTVPNATAGMCDRNVASAKELSTSMLDRRASSKQLLLDRISTSSSFGRETGGNAIQGSDFTHPNRAERKEYNVGHALHWGSSSSSIMRSSMEGACMSTLLRENTHDIDECGSSSRTSSNSSGNTIRASAGINESSIIMQNYSTTSRPIREREGGYVGSAISASEAMGPSKQTWFQDSVAGVLAASAKRGGAGVGGNNVYGNLAGAASCVSGQGGPFTPNVFSGTKSSNSKEASNYVIRICAQCKTMRTPLWRNGPQGPKSLCNACGIRYKKEERRSAAVEDRLHQPEPPDQRPRSSSMDRAEYDPRVTIEDRRSRFCNDNRRPRFVADTLDSDQDQRPKFVNITDQASRFPAAREKRPKLVNDSYRSS